MTKKQLTVIGIFLVLFGLFYFVFDTKPRERAAIDQERVENAVQTDIRALLTKATAGLTKDQQHLLGSLQQMLNAAEADSLKIPILEELSGKWYGFGRQDIAGHYAEEIAKITNKAEAWSIAGTTYAIGGQQLKDEKQRNYATEHAVAAFENAISVEPDNVSHRVNLAVCYVDNPPEDNPMKGIQMLLSLDKQHPEAVGVQNTLARFAIKTGQFDKAVLRLEKVLSLQPENKRAICLIAKAYEGIGKMKEAAAFAQKCTAQQ